MSNGPTQSPGPLVSEEQWRRMRSAWFSIFTKEDFKPKSIIQLLCKQTKTLKYGQVDRVLDGSSAFVKIADGVFMVVTAANTIWSFVPNTHIDKAKKAVSACWDAARTLSAGSPGSNRSWFCHNTNNNYNANH